MRIAEINMLLSGSTGRIMLQIADFARQRGHVVDTYSPYDYSPKYVKMPSPPDGHTYFGTFLSRWIHNIIGRIIGCNGCLSYFATKRLIKKLKKDKVDLIHLHNLHNYCINLPLLFRYFKKTDTPVVWTLHDCWTFTGHCPHFDKIGCDKWKIGCYDCPQYRCYPQCKVDNSRYMYRLKKKWFTDVANMTLVTPSNWLGDLVKQSFLGEYPVKVINNGIDLSHFKPRESDFRHRYGCEDKYIILAVAFDWGESKGLDVITELSNRLDDRFQLVLVGTSSRVDSKLPDNIITIHKTMNQQDLAEIYTAADLFINPTREEVFGLVNLEALACGTPVLTFNTGGSPECIDKTCGSVVEKNDIDKMEQEIISICTTKRYSSDACQRRAQLFDMNQKISEYISLYEKIYN